MMRYTDSLRIGCGDRLTLLQSCAYSGSVSSLFAALLNGASSHPVDLRREGIQGWHGASRPSGSPCSTASRDLPRARRHQGRRFTSLRVVRLEGDLAGACDAVLFRPASCGLHPGQRSGRDRDRA